MGFPPPPAPASSKWRRADSASSARVKPGFQHHRGDRLASPRPAPHFPLELYDMIVDSVAPQDWRTWSACSLTNKALHTRSRQHLFRTLVLQEDKLWTGSALVFLASAPQLAALVQEVVFTPPLSSSASVACGGAGSGKAREQHHSPADGAPVSVSVDAHSVTAILDRLPNAHTVELRGVTCTPRQGDPPSGRYWIPARAGRRLRALVFGGAVEDFDIAATLRLFSRVPVGALRLLNSPRWPWPDDGDGDSGWYGLPEPALAEAWPVDSVEICAHAELAAYYTSLLAKAVSRQHIRRIVLSRTIDFGGEILDFLEKIGPGLVELEIIVADGEALEDLEQLARQLSRCHGLRTLVVAMGRFRDGHQVKLLKTLLAGVPGDLEILRLHLPSYDATGCSKEIWGAVNQELCGLRKLRRLEVACSEQNEDRCGYVLRSMPAREQTAVNAALPVLAAKGALGFIDPAMP